jgi:hypothetical protein
MVRFWNNLHQVPQHRKIGKLNNLIVFGSNTIKGLKQGIQNRIWSPMSERGTLVLIIHNNMSLKVCFGTALHYKSNQRTMKEEKPSINSLKI